MQMKGQLFLRIYRISNYKIKNNKKSDYKSKNNLILDNGNGRRLYRMKLGEKANSDF